MCRYLIARGADCRKPNRYGQFPMFMAAMNGRLKIIKLLFHENGAHEDIRRLDTYGNSPLRVALYYGNDNTIQWLTLNGALALGNDVDKWVFFSS